MDLYPLRYLTQHNWNGRLKFTLSRSGFGMTEEAGLFCALRCMPIHFRTFRFNSTQRGYEFLYIYIGNCVLIARLEVWFWQALNPVPGTGWIRIPLDDAGILLRMTNRVLSINCKLEFCWAWQTRVLSINCKLEFCCAGQTKCCQLIAAVKRSLSQGFPNEIWEIDKDFFPQGIISQLHGAFKFP